MNIQMKRPPATSPNSKNHHNSIKDSDQQTPKVLHAQLETSEASLRLRGIAFRNCTNHGPSIINLVSINNTHRNSGASDYSNSVWLKNEHNQIHGQMVVIAVDIGGVCFVYFQHGARNQSTSRKITN